MGYQQEIARAATRALLREAAAIGMRLSSDHALPPTDARAMHLLDTLAGDRAATPSLLARELGLSPGATTALIDRLVDAGLIVRVRDLPDRRQVRLALSEDARTAGRSLLEPLGQRVDAATDRLGPADAAAVAAFLTDVLGGSPEEVPPGPKAGA